MIGSFRTVDEARERFETYVRLEPRLRALWAMCEAAAPPRVERDEDDEEDAEADEPAWCAETYFLEVVKPRLRELVGWHRHDGPAELRTPAAYQDVHDALFHHALVYRCACCREAAC